MAANPSALLIVNSQLVSQPDTIARLKSELDSYDVHQQLLERLVESAVSLPRNKFSKVFVADGALSSDVADHLYESLKDGGVVSGNIKPESKTSLVMSGFVSSSNGWVKSGTGATSSTTLSLKKPASSTKPSTVLSFKRAADVEPTRNDEEEYDIIDEDDLISDDTATPAFNFPQKCDPGPGKKRRRACKDCTCGLKEAEMEEEDVLKKNRSAIKLAADDMAEIDFTVPGKAVGGCGSCALGDAFRCDGCPYLGLPPFKPGEVVSIDQFGDDL